jgi:hypothetical protein
MRPAALTTLCCTFLVLNLLAFMTVAAVLPTLIAEWEMSNTQAGWLGGIYFAGYMVAVPFLLPLTDRIPPKAISLGGGIVGAASALSFGLLADGFWSGLILRFFGGVAMAGAYMPTLKIIADSLDEPWRSRASSYYTSVFAIGTAISILAGGAIADAFGWRWSFAAAGLGNLAALGIGAVWLPAGSSNGRRMGRSRKPEPGTVQNLCGDVDCGVVAGADGGLRPAAQPGCGHRHSLRHGALCRYGDCHGRDGVRRRTRAPRSHDGSARHVGLRGRHAGPRGRRRGAGYGGGAGAAGSLGSRLACGGRGRHDCRAQPPLRWKDPIRIRLNRAVTGV